jgi:hypothetical protein
VRKDMFDRVKILQVAGNGIRAIVRETGFNWRTVAKWGAARRTPRAKRHGCEARPRRATFRTISRGAGRRDAPLAGIIPAACPT